MFSIQKIVFAAAIALSVASSAKADNLSGNSPFSNTPRYPTLGSYFFGSHKQALPTFQAAPWYLYWPYDAHFQTPAPVYAPFYAPPSTSNFPVNPYFSTPGGLYGPIPGGPAPVMAPGSGHP